MNSKQRQAVDIVVDHLKATASNPHCPHGPSLMFERYIDHATRRFYACSACRDRKMCDFFQEAGKPMSKGKQKERRTRMLELQKSPLTADVYKQRLETIQKLETDERAICKSCEKLLLPSEVKGHRGHDLVLGVSEEQLGQPTSLLSPLDIDKSNAQYLFSPSTLTFLLDTISKLGFTKVLCIGAPSVHEAVLARSGTKMSSLLLDLDQRLEQFYSPTQYCRYNMFNQFFFRGKSAAKTYTKFLQSSGPTKKRPHGDLVVIMDPPFGGLVDVLSHTVRHITDEWQAANQRSTGSLPFLWVFPYFLGPRITEALPTFNMIHYKLEYGNHKAFKEASGKVSEEGSEKSSKKGSKKGSKKDSKKGSEKGLIRPQGSPVRVFTNLPPATIHLPKPTFRLCTSCETYVPSDVKHCNDCDTCTCKDGRPYIHCSTCGRCVKPTWAHCGKCESCHLPQYNCSAHLKTGCHICGEMSHKRRDCPQANKRKSTEMSGATSKKRKQ